MNPNVTFYLLLLKSPVNIHAWFEMSEYKIYLTVSF